MHHHEIVVDHVRADFLEVDEWNLAPSVLEVVLLVDGDGGPRLNVSLYGGRYLEGGCQGGEFIHPGGVEVADQQGRRAHPHRHPAQHPQYHSLQ